jgi:hypothetical protein
MILNVFSITEIFIGLLSLILMAWGGILSFILAWRWRRSSKAEERTHIEGRSHLVLLVAVVVLVIRLFNWPLFYATLQSFIPEINGAMCIFGVTQVNPILTRISEIIKPISFFLIGAWLLIHALDQSTQTSPLMGRKFLFLSIIALVVIVENLLDIVLFLRIAPGMLISCCTTVTDILERPTRLVPKSILGPEYAFMLHYGTYASTLLLLVLLALGLRSMGRSSNPRWRRPVLGFLFFYAILNASLFLLAHIEVFAPKMMGLPFHHCLYCLWQYVPDSILMMFLYVLGTFAAGWAFLLDLVGRTSETLVVLSKYLRTLYSLSIFCLTSSLVMLAIHMRIT